MKVAMPAPQRLHLRRLCHTSVRRQGVARALLSAILQNAKRDSSLEQLLLAVTATQNAAMQLYLDLGFKIFGREPNALKVGSEYVDEEHMILLTR
jgi:GNAT superfamily N-acetyltransferase